MGSILSPPFAFDGESLGKRKNEWIWNFLGKTGEEMQTYLNGKEIVKFTLFVTKDVASF